MQLIDFTIFLINIHYFTENYCNYLPIKASNAKNFNMIDALRSSALHFIGISW